MKTTTFARMSQLKLGSALMSAATLLPYEANAVDILDHVPFYTNTIEAAYTTVSDDKRTVIYTSDARPVPNANVPISKDEQSINNFFGAHNMRLCGGAVGANASIVSIRPEWRIAHQGHSTPFKQCGENGDGCNAFGLEVYPEGRACITFSVSRGIRQNGDYDFRLTMRLASPVLASPDGEKKKAVSYERFGRSGPDRWR